MIQLYVGFDPREAAAYHVFCQSVIEHSSVPVAFIPLHSPMLADFDGQRDGSNAFIYSRYLVPYLNGYKGWAMFADGDMLMMSDITDIWAKRDDKCAVMVTKHDYQTKHPRKYLGTPIENDNVDYERKNWSSVMLFNCGHEANRVLSREFVAESYGAFLHRFTWLNDDEIGDLGPQWNHLIGEYPKAEAKLVHYTLGVPGFKHYSECDYSDEWKQARKSMNNLIGEPSG